MYNELMSKIFELSEKIRKETLNVFKGNKDVVDMIIASLLAGGHVLLEDVPGTGKTVLAKSIAKASGLDFSRIQCTPDLMPSDVTGSSVWIPSKSEFEFRKGPVMAGLVLVDELNRATPRTQSALLECMAENQISIDGNMYKLPKPFFVIATENPVESEGTFPLPEAQKDRFMMCLSMGYPKEDAEKEIILAQNTMVHPVENVKSVVTKEEILKCMEEALKVYVDDSVLNYILLLAKYTREDSRLLNGVSPRATLALYKAGQCYAAVNNRNYVTPEDIKKLTIPVFRKRIILSTDSVLKGYKAESILEEMLEQTNLPDFKAKV